MAKKKLMVVDYQNDFVDGALGFESAKNLDERILEVVKRYIEDEDGIVVCTFDTHEENYLETQEGKKLPVKHRLRGTDGHKLYGKTGEYIYSLYDGVISIRDGRFGDSVITTCPSEEFDVYDKLYLVEKPTFPSLPLGNFLRNLNNSMGIESIEIVGLVTNMCVMGNAVCVKAACPEAEIIVRKDLVDSFDKDLHNKALDVMASMQMTIR